MPSSSTIVAALLALAPLALSLPQQSVQTAQGAVNPINGLGIPGTATASASEDTDSAPTLTALTQPSPSSSSDKEDEDISTITASATLSSPTDSSSPSDSTESEPPNTDTNVVIWTDTAENTVYTVTRSTTSFIPVPTMQVPPNEGDVATATITGADGKPTPTHDVDTFVQGYTGGGQRGAEAKVWWLLGGAVAMGALVVL